MGDFTTDSSGCFAYTLKKVKNTTLYNISIEGNQAYDLSNQILGLSDRHNYGKFLLFEINRIVASWIDALSAHPLGGLVLGFGLLWSDLVYYTIGIGFGVIMEKVF